MSWYFWKILERCCLMPRCMVHLFHNILLTLTAITCTSLSPIANGLIGYESNTFNFGTSATYTCTDGFFLIGGNSRRCGGDGTSVNGVWSETAPICSGM